MMKKKLEIGNCCGLKHLVPLREKLEIPVLQAGFTLIELLVVIVIIGILATFTITNYQGVKGRARDAKRKLRQVVYRSQASDHPIIWNMENTNYLKFLIVQVQ